jgi:SPP1 family predicted phage head-tail adaptor
MSAGRRPIGKLRHRIVLQSKVETRGAAGGVVSTWETQDTVFGAIEPLSGKEYLSIQQTQNEASVRIVIRYNASVDATWRAVNGGRAYDIQAVINDDSRNIWLTLMCLHGVKNTGDLPTENAVTFDLTKDPDSVIDTGINWLPTMNESSPQDTISTSAWAADNELTVDSDTNTTSTTTVWVSGGTEGKYANLVNKITTPAGRTHDRTIVVKIQNR